jgi:hypothetical protein
MNNKRVRLCAVCRKKIVGRQASAVYCSERCKQKRAYSVNRDKRREYRAANSAYYAEYGRAYRAAHRDKYNKYQRAYYCPSRLLRSQA